MIDWILNRCRESINATKEKMNSHLLPRIRKSTSQCSILFCFRTLVAIYAIYDIKRNYVC